VRVAQRAGGGRGAPTTRSVTARAYVVWRRAKAIRRFRRGELHEPDFAFFRRFGDDEGLFLDVGANLGMSALSVRTVLPRARIVSVEPNPLHGPDLRRVARRVRRMEVLQLAASDRPGELELHVPTWRGVPITGEASLSREAVLGSDQLRARLGDGMESGRFAIRSFVVPVRPLDELGLAPRFVKVDVQGVADAVLRGLEETLARHRPIVMVESEGRTNAAVIEQLGRLGYDACVYDAAADELRPFADQGPQNIFFVPQAGAQAGA
jgi:FkbM family methyltransferase